MKPQGKDQLLRNVPCPYDARNGQQRYQTSQQLEQMHVQSLNPSISDMIYTFKVTMIVIMKITPTAWPLHLGESPLHGDSLSTISLNFALDPLLADSSIIHWSGYGFGLLPKLVMHEEAMHVCSEEVRADQVTHAQAVQLLSCDKPKQSKITRILARSHILVVDLF